MTEHRREFLALHEIGAAGFRAHLPLYVSRQRGHLPKILPLFPGYLFVAFDREGDPWGKLRSARGVSDLLMSGPERPAQVPVGEVEALMARGRAGDGVIDESAPAFPAFKAGETVRIAAGPFADMRAVVRMAERDRVTVLLDLLGRPMPARLAARDVVRVS